MAFLILVNSERLGFSGPRVHLETLFKGNFRKRARVNEFHIHFFLLLSAATKFDSSLGPQYRVLSSYQLGYQDSQKERHRLVEYWATEPKRFFVGAMLITILFFYSNR